MRGPMLVLGAGGQLGQEITAHASSEGTVGATRAEADIIDERAITRLLALLKPRLVVNCAAYTAVDRAESEPAAAWNVNVLGAANVARAAATSAVPLIHISTDYVFDGSKIGAYGEDDAVEPINIYGRTKAEGEEQVRASSERHIILRTSWLFGKYGNNFLKTVLRLSSKRDSLRVVADQIGCPTATKDLVEAIFAIDRKLTAGGSVDWGTYHFAGDGFTSWHGFAESIMKARPNKTGATPVVSPITSADCPTAARRPANSVLDSTRFQTAFDYRAAPWQARVIETVQDIFDRAEAE